MTAEAPRSAIAELTGDAFFVCPTRRAAGGAAAAGAPTYLYSFQRDLSSPFMQNLGAFHRHLVLDAAIASGAGYKTAVCDFWDALVVP